MAAIADVDEFLKPKFLNPRFLTTMAHLFRGSMRLRCFPAFSRSLSGTPAQGKPRLVAAVD
jgi:hypothetical protein